MKIKFALLFSFLAFITLNLFSSEKNTPLTIPTNGIYDGIIGEQKIILVAEETTQLFQKGYFVIYEGKAVEETHSYTLKIEGKKMIFNFMVLNVEFLLEN